MLAFTLDEERLIGELISDLGKGGPGAARMRAMAGASPADHRLLVEALIRLEGSLGFDPDATPARGVRTP